MLQLKQWKIRSKTPVIDVEFTLLITKVNVTKNKTPFGLFTAQKIEEKSIRYECTLKFRAVNNGQILAKYVNYYIYVPQQIIENIEESDLQDGYYVRYEDNAPTRIKEIKWEDIIVEEQSKEEYIDNIPHFAPNI